jgi:hypothetical protein
MSDENSESEPEKKPPPIPLDYNSIPEPSILPAFFGGFAWGFLGLGFVVGYVNIEGTVIRNIQSRTGSQPVVSNPQFDPTALVEIGIAVACAVTFYFLYQSSWRKRRPFFLGWLAGASGAFLASGICWAAR